ncbi:MAG: hypothetical protein QOK31_1564 [Solirubrobacteraceae bacterium]|nr:hypothetical protein [Solirubrobacteraceae bacterium]
MSPDRRFLRPALSAVVVLLGLAPAAGATPIPESPDANNSPAFIGRPAVQRPLFAPHPPRHPFMAPNERSNLHVDAYQTDVNPLPGPLGRAVQRLSTSQFADCASVTLDSRGRIVVVCVGLQGPAAGGAGLYMFDRRTLATLAKFDLPPRQPGIATDLFTDFAGGGYFYLDNHDRAVIPTTTRHVFVVGETPGPGFALRRDYDLTGVVPSGDKIISALPDWSGRIWAVSKAGVVVTIDPRTGALRSRALKEKVGNSIAVDDARAVYVVSDAALYRLYAGGDGAPRVRWRRTYANDGRMKPGQTEVGSGTTPTVMTAGPWVTITDNADPIDVVVYDRRTGARICSVPVFKRGASDTDQSLIAVGNAIVAENNYGYSGPAATEQGKSTTPGLERVDVRPGGHGCRKVWHSNEIAPSVVPKASLANGLLYTYTKPAGERSDPWYLTALDFRTGRTVFKARAGAGLGFNNNYAPVTIGPDGTAYVGTLGGLVAVRDLHAPRPPRLRLFLRLRYRRGPGRCSRSNVLADVVGRDAHGAVRATFLVDSRRVGHRRAPLRFLFRRATLTRGHTATLSARLVLADGRRLTRRRRVRPCG